MTLTTDYKDGWLVIKETENLSSEPVQQTMYWPVKQEGRTFLESMEILGKEAIYYSGGVYSVRIAPYQNIDLRLIDGGQTRPIAVERTPLEQPKARKGQTIRYCNGRWEKCTRTTGWVAL